MEGKIALVAIYRKIVFKYTKANAILKMRVIIGSFTVKTFRFKAVKQEQKCVLC